MSINKKLVFVIPFVVSIVMVGALFVVIELHDSSTHKSPQLPTIVDSPPVIPVASEVFTDVNNERVKAGLPPLTDDPRLDASAAAKCQDMITRDYFAHNDPQTGAAPWHFITDQGVNYQYAGENLAYNYDLTSQQVVDSWMNSTDHKANILDSQYVEAGIAICTSPNYLNTDFKDNIEVQHFIGL